MNASPVILLAKAGVVQLVPQICEQLVVPAAVLEEVRGGRMSDAGRAWLESDGAKYITQPVATPAALIRGDLGLGETQVLAWLMAKPGWTGILDDLKARRCAKGLGLPILGSLRVLLILKERGLITAVRPALDAFQEAGAYFSAALIQQALEIAGES